MKDLVNFADKNFLVFVFFNCSIKERVIILQMQNRERVKIL
jgi:hypothetical protein